jgi:hypothetical protein
MLLYFCIFFLNCVSLTWCNLELRQSVTVFVEIKIVSSTATAVLKGMHLESY